MINQDRLDEYVAELRKEVCSRCNQPAPGGPPCTPLGRPCEFEMYLPEIVALAHSLELPAVEKQLEQFQEYACASCPRRSHEFCHCPSYYLSPSCPRCPLRESGHCHCPAYYLLPVAVMAIRSVDDRHDAGTRAKMTKPLKLGVATLPG